jgi:hypothetical protein
MNKLTLVFILALCLASVGFAYLPISINATSYGQVANLSSNSSGALEVNYSVTYPGGTTEDLLTTNIGTIFWNTTTLNETGTWTVLATSDVETNSTTFSITCPSWQTLQVGVYCLESLSPYIDRNLTYFDVAATITIWTNVNLNSGVTSIYLYNSANATYPFVYSVSRNSWYIYYTVRQTQEVVTVQSFKGAIPSGVGDLTITINKNPPSPSFFEEAARNIGYFLIIMVAAGIILSAIVIIGPMLVGFMLNRMK